MRKNILFVLFTVSMSASCNAILGDFSSNPDGGKDASTDHTSDVKIQPEAGDGGGGEGGKLNLNVRATGEDVWVAQTATVDGSKSTASAGKLSYAWDFMSVPSGSSISKTSLSNASAAKPTFVPDVAGKYVLTLTVTDGSQNASAQATVNAIAPQVFYNKSIGLTDGGISDPEGGGSVAYWVGDYDGKNTHAVMCPTAVPNITSIGNLGVWPLLSAVCLDFLEGEAGAPVQYAGFTLELNEAGDASASLPLQTHLWAGTSSSSCTASPPTDLGVYPAASTNDAFAYGPRFSRDGKQIAFHDSHLNIVTISTSGGGATIVDKYYASDPSGAALSAPFDVSPGLFGTGGLGSIVPSPDWHGTSVAWARAVDAANWEIVTAPNTSNAPVSVYMKCPGITPREIAFLKDGTVLVAYRASTSGPVNMTLFKTGSSQNCTAVHTYSNLSDSATSVATAFSLSPDETQIAFTVFDPATADASLLGGGITVGSIYTAPVDGTSPPTRISNDQTIYGPRWIGDGHLLAFDKLGPVLPDAAFGVPSFSIVTISPESGTEAVVDTGDGVHSIVALSSSFSCSSTARPIGAGAFALLSLVIAARIGMQRRKRRS